MAMPLIDDRSLDHVIYPESDDEPMSECALQGLAIRTLVLGFERLYSGRDDVFVGADQFWYPVKGEPKIVAAPDTMVVVGLPVKPTLREIGSYRQWEHGGHVALAIEVLSPSNTWAEMVRKRQFYDRHGVDEYWVFDPAAGALEVWVREADALSERAVPETGLVSPTSGVLLKVVAGELAVHDPGGGRRWLSPLDEVARAEHGAARAEHEAARAEHEAARADAAERRLSELEARLAELERTQSGT